MNEIAVEHAENDRFWKLLFVKKLESEAAKAFQILRTHDVDALLIKGAAASRNYPDDKSRFYSDIDIAVSAADFDKAMELIGSRSGTKISVDLHAEFRHLDTKSWSDVLRDSIEIRLEEETVRIPSAEDHLRILIIHWLNDGGVKKDRLWDIYYAIKNRPPDFDWDKCLNCVSENRRQWIISAIGLTHKYLQLDIDDLPFAERAKDLPQWLYQVVEKEWESNLPLRPLLIHDGNLGETLQQIRKRFPPNAIQATIEMEGSFDNGSRLRYQLGSMLKRTGPFIKGLLFKLKQNDVVEKQKDSGH